MRRLLPWGAARRLVRAGLFVVAAAILLAAVLAVAVVVTAARDPGPVAAGAAPQSWVEVNRPIAMYDLTGTEFARLPRDYRARRHLPDGAREDVIAFGERGTGKPYLRLALLRLGAGEGGGASMPIGAGGSLGDDLARLAAARSETISRLGVAAAVETRFGRMEEADLLLWAGGRASLCLGFRGMAGDGDVLRFAGFACGATGHPVGHAALACTIDRIDLVSAAGDGPLRAAFVAAERRSGGACHGGADSTAAGENATPGRLALAGQKANWLDSASDMPAFRAGGDDAVRTR